jgi:molecular chaperone HtpG
LNKGDKTSLADYVKRLSADQKEIYYILAANREAAVNSPYFEVFNERKLEVLFLYDPWDEFVMDHLREFDGKKLIAAEKADVHLDKNEEAETLSAEAGEQLAKWFKEKLGDGINEVRVSKRLVGSPAVVLDADKFMTSSMRQMMKSMNREGANLVKHDLEINPSHPMIVQLEKIRATSPELAGKVGEQIVDNARLAAGLLEDPKQMLNRLNDLLQQVLQKTT